MHPRLGANSAMRCLDWLLIGLVISKSMEEMMNSKSQKIVKVNGRLYGKPHILARTRNDYTLTEHQMSRFPWSDVRTWQNFSSPIGWAGGFITRSFPAMKLCKNMSPVDIINFDLLEHDTLVIEFAKVRHRQHDQEKISPFHNLPPKLFRKIIGMVLGV